VNELSGFFPVTVRIPNFGITCSTSDEFNKYYLILLVAIHLLGNYEMKAYNMVILKLYYSQ
jgi:hypothetical protein